MHPACKLFGKQAVNEPMPINTVFSRKFFTNDLNAKMRFAFGMMMTMTGMVMGLINEF
jgi:hypothetical protein